MRKAQKIVFHDRDVAGIVNALRTDALMLAAILLTLFAIAARGAFAGAFVMLAATLRPSRRVSRRVGGEIRAVSRVRRLHAIKAAIERTPRPRAGPIWRRCTPTPLRFVA
jgi:hypothetical protein